MNATDQSYRYIVIEGPIGVGKTTLTRRVAESLGGELLLEAAEENPFLERFYENPRHAALPTQLHFLFQRVRQLEPLNQADLFRPLCIADFLLEKDRLFAHLNLDEHERELYDQIWATLSPRAPAPDLVVYLQAPVPVLMERIARRARPCESRLDGDYLERLSAAYLDFFHHYSGAPVLIVNAAEANFERSDADYTALLQEIADRPRGRRYFNPLPVTLS